MKTHQDCTDCGHKECLTIFDDGGSKCHSCGKGKAGKPVVKTSPVTVVKDTYDNHRGILEKTNRFYGFTTGVDAEGNPVSRSYSYPSQKKVRILPKDFSKNFGFKSTELGGRNLFNASTSRILTITEGEEDAASAYQMLGSKYPVCFLPSATVSKKFMMENHEYINSFDEIVMCTDSDEAGDSAALRFAEAFPNKVYRMNMTKYNDPNEFLMAGAGKDFMYAHINRTKYVPEFDTSTSEGFIEMFREGKDCDYIPTGIEAFDEEHLGLMQACLTVIKASEGTGKTEVFRYLEHHLIKKYPEISFAACHLEEPQVRSLLGLVSYDLEQNVTRKELILDPDVVEDSIINLTKSGNVHFFRIGIDEDPMVVVDRIKYYANVCECKYIFLEPIQDLAHQRVGGDTIEQFLSKLSVLLSRTAAETGVGIVVIAHENEDGDTRDCKMIAKQASVVIKLVRDKTATDEEEKNTTTLWSEKNRPSSFIGYGGQLSFDVETFTIKEKV